MKKRKGVLLLELIVSIAICIMLSFVVIKLLDVNHQFNNSMKQHRNYKNELDNQLYSDNNISLKNTKKSIKETELKTGNFKIPVKVVEVSSSNFGMEEKLYFIESVKSNEDS